VTFPLAAERPWHDAWPLVAQTDDSNPWVTGGCWLYCRREGVRVLWVGSVSTPGATGDVFACGQCIAELAYMVRLQGHRRDGIVDRAAQSAPLTVPPHTPSANVSAGGSSGRYRLPRRNRGRTPATPWGREAR
jgi:hypothetical protein